MVQDPDRHHIERVVNGDPNAFRPLVDAYQKKAYGLALKMLKRDDVAQDAVQEAFVRAFKGLPTFQFGSTFATWFYRIVYTTCLNVLRAERRLPVLEEYTDDSEAAWFEPEIFEAMDRETIEEILAEELAQMSAMYAAVLDLFYIKECSYAEIVRVTGMPLGTIKTRLNRGRALLRTAVIARMPELGLQLQEGGDLQ